MQKTAVIFGGHGFVGSHLARHLVASGSYARVVSADIAAQPRFRTEGVDYLYCDIRNEIPENFVPAVTDIYNLAAIHTTPGHEDWEYFWTNVMGATRVCDYARRAKAETIFFTSSISVYGPSEVPISEDMPPKPVSAYGQSKFCAETIHHSWHREDPAHRRLIIARPSVIFGYTEGGNYTRLARLLRYGLFFYAGRKDTVKACGYVKDLIASFDYFLQRPIDAITYNFSYTERYTIENICDCFKQVAGYGMPKGVVPIWFMMIAGFAFEILNFFGLRSSINRARILKLFCSTNVVPKRLDESGFVRGFDLKAALEDWKQESGGRNFR